MFTCGNTLMHAAMLVLGCHALYIGFYKYHRIIRIFENHVLKRVLG